MSQSPYDPQPDNGSNSYNSSSGQTYQNQQPAYQQPTYQQPTYQQPMYAQPMMAVVPKTPQQIAGEQAAQTSMTLGVIGIVLLLTGVGGVVTLILGIIGVKKAAEAERQGVPATGGKVMGWISLIVGGPNHVVSYLVYWLLYLSHHWGDFSRFKLDKELPGSGVYPRSAHVSFLRQNVGVS